MGLETAVLLAILLAALVLLYTQWIPPDLTALLVLLSLIVPWRPEGGSLHPFLTPGEGFSGFGSPAVIMVTAMFVVSAGLVRTGAAELLGRRLFERCAHREILLQGAVLGAVTLFSSVVNDTAAVLVWMPVVITICRERGLSPSRYLLGVAYGSLLGGQWTLIGTRSNIVVSDYLRARTGAPLGFFAFTPPALAIFVACAAFYLLIGVRFLPKSDAASLAEDYQVTEFLTEVMLTPHSEAVGSTFFEAKLEDTHGVQVIEVIRGGKPIARLPDMRLEHGDVLLVQGPSSKIARLLKTPAFEVREELKVAEGTLRSLDLVMVEALVTRGSTLAGRRVVGIDFVEECGLSVMAVAREGKKLGFRPLDMPLHPGDTLLLYGHKAGVERLRGQPDLLLLDSRPFPAPVRWRGFLMLGLLAAMVATIASGVLPAAVAIPLAAAGTILSGCLRMPEVYEAIDWMSVVVVGGMIPFGIALEKTGTAERLAGWFVGVFAGAPPVVLLGALVALAITLTQLIENAAVAIVLAPIFYNVATQAALDPTPVLLALAIAVSAAFMTPVAHESTILVMGPGRYHFRHYLQVGSGLAILTWIVTTLAVASLYTLKP